MFEAWLSDGVSRDDDNAELRRTFEKDVMPFIGDKPVRPSALTFSDPLVLTGS